jgi:tRNA(Arg) A34 adenosine deaminase TadA
MTDRELLQRAVAIAQNSPEPVGCGVVITSTGEIIAEDYNSQRIDKIAVNHAEIKAIMAANKLTGSRKLNNAVAYCSCEPCAMCLTALSYAGVQRIVFNKTMHDLFPEDPQSKLDAKAFLAGLNFVPEIQQLLL